MIYYFGQHAPILLLKTGLAKRFCELVGLLLLRLRLIGQLTHRLGSLGLKPLFLPEHLLLLA